jgi:Spy/CpxP family protein refolding chaperone
MATPTPSRISPKTTAALVVLVAFIAGLVAGAAGDRFYLIRSRQLFPHRFGQMGARRIVDHLDRDLHFTAQQRKAVEVIVDRGRARVDAVMANVRPQMRQEIDTTNAEIEKVLTPEQRAKFDAMKMRMQHDRDRRHPGPGGSRPLF